MGAGDGHDHAAGHLGGFHAHLGVHRRHHQVEALQHVGVLVELAVGEDVDLDAGEDAERCELLVEPLDLVELGDEAVPVEPVGHGEAGRVVGDHQVLVAQGHGGPGHGLDRCAAVAPQAVAVAVTAEGGPQLGPGPEGDLGGLLQGDDAGGYVPGHRLGDHLGGALADAGQLGEGPAGRALLHLALGQGPDHLGRLQERGGLLGGQQAAVLEVGDPLQRLDRGHPCHQLAG